MRSPYLSCINMDTFLKEFEAPQKDFIKRHDKLILYATKI